MLNASFLILLIVIFIGVIMAKKETNALKASKSVFWGHVGMAVIGVGLLWALLNFTDWPALGLVALGWIFIYASGHKILVAKR